MWSINREINTYLTFQVCPVAFNVRGRWTWEWGPLLFVVGGKRVAIVLLARKFLPVLLWLIVLAFLLLTIERGGTVAMGLVLYLLVVMIKSAGRWLLKMKRNFKKVFNFFYRIVHP